MQPSTALDENFKSNVNSHGSALAVEIFQHIDRAHHLLLSCGHPTRAYTKSAIESLLSFNPERQLKVLNNAKNLFGLLANIENEIEPKSESEYIKVNEVALTKKALNFFGIHMKDQTWEAKVQDRIIEVYNHQGVQLHRSLNFFKICGYSLLDLCVHEWYVLWERPSKIVNELNEVVAQVMSGAPRPTTAVPVSPHIIRETYNDGSTQPFLPRSVLIHFCDMFPTFNSEEEICGFVVTSEVRLMDVGDEAMKLGFI